LDQSPIDEALCCVLFMAMEKGEKRRGDENGKGSMVIIAED
jgi:hypothetical protein